MKLVLFSLLSFFSIQALALSELTLKEALQKANSSSPELKVSTYDYDASLGALKMERSVFFPTIGVEGGYQKFDSDSEYISGTFGNLFGEYKFDLGGSEYFQYRAASTEADIAALKKEQIQKFLQWSIETKFSRALYLQESIKLYESALEQNKTYAQMAQKKKSSGLASDADVIEFDLNEAILRSDLEEIKTEFSEANNDLRISLGLESDEEIALKGNLDHFHISETLEQVKGKLNQSSYGLKISSLESQRASYMKSSSYSGFLPELTLRATYGRRGMDEPAGPEQTYFVIARWELFSGFKDAGAFQKASALQEKAEYERRLSERNLPNTIVTEFKKFLAIQNRVDLESQNRERSKKYLSTVMNEYKRGVKNSADLKSASLQLLETSLRDLKYRFEGIKQKETLQSLLGDSINFEVYSTQHKVN